MAAPYTSYDTATPSAIGVPGRAHWTADQKIFLLEVLVPLKKPGKAWNAALTKEHWYGIARKLNVTFSCCYTIDQLKSQVPNIKKEYDNYQSLMNHEGFTWDESQTKVNASETVWEERIQSEGPWVKRFRDHRYRLRGLARRLFDETDATTQVPSGVEVTAAATPRPDPPVVSAPASLSSSSEHNADEVDAPVDAPVEVFTTSVRPHKRHRRDSGLSKLADSLVALKSVVQTALEKEKNELQLALDRFDTYAETQIMSLQTNVMCKRLLGIDKNAIVFLSMKEPQYNTYFEVLFAENPRQPKYDARPRNSLQDPRTQAQLEAERWPHNHVYEYENRNGRNTGGGANNPDHGREQGILQWRDRILPAANVSRSDARY